MAVVVVAPPGFVHVITANSTAGFVAGFAAVGFSAVEGCDVHSDGFGAFIASLFWGCDRSWVPLDVTGEQQE